MMRDTHAQAMSVQEAAMLPAIAPSRPGHITMPLNQSHFIPMNAVEAAAPQRCGSCAGRAILHTSGVHLPGVKTMRCNKKRRIRVTDDEYCPYDD